MERECDIFIIRNEWEESREKKGVCFNNESYVCFQHFFLWNE